VCVLEVTELHPNSKALCEKACLYAAPHLDRETPERAPNAQASLCGPVQRDSQAVSQVSEM